MLEEITNHTTPSVNLNNNS